MEMKRHWIPKNFELTFPVFFYHNFKEMYHLVRVIDLKSLQILKSPLFIRFMGWLWKILVFEFVQSKGYPFTKNPSFLIILIKIRQYPWDFILEKIHDFHRNFLEIVKILKIFFHFSFPLFLIFLDISQFFEWLSKENRLERCLNWIFTLESRCKINFGFLWKTHFMGLNEMKSLLGTWNPNPNPKNFLSISSKFSS